MTLIKFNIENKTKEQRKKEVLNKLHKIQSLVESDTNYTEMVYHIITNTSLQKKNIKVNLDHYGNYTVIDAKNKIVGGGLFNSNSIPVVQTHVNNTVKSKANMTTKGVNNKNKNMNKSSINSNKKTISLPKTNTSMNQTTNDSDITPQPSSDIDELIPQESMETEIHSEQTDVSDESLSLPPETEMKIEDQQEKEHSDVSDEPVSDLDEQVSKSDEPVSNSNETKTKKTSFLNTLFGTSKDKTSSTETQANTSTDEEKPKETGTFGIPKFWGGKNKALTNDDSSFPTFQTTIFNDGSEDIFMEHIKNMSSKKYLRSLTIQELKDIMRSNHMKVTINGTYYNKEQMVNKVYQFYK